MRRLTVWQDIYIYNPRAQEKTTKMWRFNRGGNKNATKKSQKHDKENNRGDDEHPKQESKRQCRGEYLIKKRIKTSHSKWEVNKSTDTAHNTETTQANWTGTTEEISKIVNSNQSELMSIINKVIKEGIWATQPRPFKFENTSEAAAHNTKILEEHKFDLSKVLEKYENTVFHPGTEFCH